MSDIAGALREPWPNLRLQREGVGVGMWLFFPARFCFSAACSSLAQARELGEFGCDIHGISFSVTELPPAWVQRYCATTAPEAWQRQRRS